ncbi:MAG: hypothetical protein AB1349_04045 [Elusimicrobiota bacterium]
MGIDYGLWSIVLAILGVYYAVDSNRRTNKTIKEFRESTQALIKSEDERAKQILEKIEKHIDEGNKRTQQMIDEGNKRLEEGNKRLEEGDRRLEKILAHISDSFAKAIEKSEVAGAGYLRDKQSDK